MAVANMSDCMQTIGNYDLLAKVAEGGMGTVYRGRNRATGEIVAVKVVPPHLLSNPVVVKRFEQEYNVSRSIDHPNIVRALDFGREGDSRYLVMQYVDGESLGQKIQRDGRMSEEEAIRIISQVALGLQAAHALNVIHRDVKPDNVLLTVDGLAKLTDLGLVKELEADLNLTRTGRGLGTPHFMAPEQFRNAKKADVRCDIYSLGATLYMMVTGELPFKSNGPLDAWMKKINNEIEAPRTRTPTLSERVDWAIRRAISPDPQHRPECCREFIEDLSGHCTKELISADTMPGAPPVYWHMTYTDEEGEFHEVNATVKGIRRSLKEGLLGDADNIRVARTKDGPYEALRHYPEFRDLVVQPAKAAPTPPPTKKSSDARPKEPLGSTPVPERAAANPATTNDAASLQKSSIGMPAVAPVRGQEQGPCINLKAGRAGFRPDVWRWLMLGVLFVGVGLGLSYFYLPILRHFRFWLGLMD